jgi:hypothetical protein
MVRFRKFVRGTHRTVSESQLVDFKNFSEAAFKFVQRQPLWVSGFCRADSSLKYKGGAPVSAASITQPPRWQSRIPPIQTTPWKSSQCRT